MANFGGAIAFYLESLLGPSTIKFISLRTTLLYAIDHFDVSRTVQKMLEMDECELIIKFHDKNQADLMPHMLILAKNCFCPKNFPMSQKFWESVPKLVIPKI